MRKTKGELIAAVGDVVHDYVNFVSAGTMVVQGRHRTGTLLPPLNTHVGHAFYLGCRKMYEFFKESKCIDVHANDYLPEGTRLNVKTPTWNKHRNHMDKFLMHISQSRTKSGKAWEGHAENPKFLQEFMEAWELFQQKLDPSYKNEFEKRIAEAEAREEYKDLDLR